MSDTLVYTTSTEEHLRKQAEQRHHLTVIAAMRRVDDAAFYAEQREENARYQRETRTVVGHCTACGSNEVLLDYAHPTTGMPSGYGCEVCS